MDRREARRSGQRAGSGSVDGAEVAHFGALAESWWDPAGPFRALHRLNPVRIAYVRDRLCALLGREAEGPSPLRGLRLLDAGCGGGLLSEPMARLGARVVGIDAAPESIAVAARHASQGGLDIDYRQTTVEALAAGGENFDAVLAMEIVEHVADVGEFVSASAALVRPGGAMALATLNRTLKSFALAIVGAEYLLRWVPRGSHRWEKFLRPSELARHLRAAGLEIEDLSGVTYDPIGGGWRLSRDTGVNYMVWSVKS